MRELGAVKDVEKVHLDAILELKNAQNNASLDLPFCIKVIKYGGDLIFVKTSDESFVEQEFSSDKTYFYRGYKYRFENGDKIIAGCTVDPDKVKGCVIRTRRDGDKFCRVNGKNKLLSDFLNEKKLNKNEKESVLVLAKGDVVYAILGVETAEQAKAEDRYLTIIKERETNE